MSLNPFARTTATPATETTPFAPWPDAETVQDRASDTPSAPTHDDQDTPSAGQPSPDDHHAGGDTQRRRLTKTEARTIRERYAYLRDLAESPESPEDWRSVRATETELAGEFGTSQAAVRNVVLGLTYPSAGGPIDTHRRARHDQYLENKRTHGAEVARSMAMSYRETPLAAPARLAVTITEPGQPERTYTYPAGTRVAMFSVATDDLDGED